ncbi:MAG: hypothetical protein AAF621_05270 [Pseudomonadota bacterium]
MIYQYLNRSYKKIFENRSFCEAIIYGFIYVFRRICGLSVMRICTLEHFNAQIEDLDTDLKLSFLKADQLQHKHYNKDIITEQDMNTALEHQDMICAISNREDHIISIGWYSSHPTSVGSEEQALKIVFPNSYAYMYKGYTEYEYRGRKLHAIGMKSSLLYFQEKGKTGLISYVDAENYRSMRSCRRLGYDFIGYIFIFTLFGKRYILSTPYLNKLGVYLVNDF